MRIHIRQTIGAALELAVITTFVLVVLWEERRTAQRGEHELVRRAL